MKTTNQINNAQADVAPVVSKQYRCIKLGLDVHADSIRVVRMIDGATPQPAQKMTPDEFPKWAAKQLTLADRVCSCYEAGPLGYGLHRKLLALGIENIVIRPQVLDEYRVRVKTDKTDALALTKRLGAPVSSHLSRIEYVVLNSLDARIAGCASVDLLLADERKTFPMFMSPVRPMAN